MSRVAELAAVLERAGIGPDYDPAQLSAALERARVVGVLDAWCEERKRVFQVNSGSYCVVYLESGLSSARPFRGATPDAARAAAAKAIEAGEV